MNTLLLAVSALEALGLVGAFVVVAKLSSRIGRLEGSASGTAAQVMAVALEAQQMGAAVAARLSEQQQSTEAPIAKPRRGRAAMAAVEVTTPQAPTSTTPHMVERVTEPATVRSVRATLDAVGPEIVMSDQDMARERGMDPLGVALQRQLVGQAIRTA